MEDGREILKEHGSLVISAKHVRKLAEEEGQLLAGQRRCDIQSYLQGRLKVGPCPVPALLVITADGGRVQMRKESTEARWKEDKIGVVYDAIPQPQADAEPGRYEGAKARTKTYVASMENWNALGEMLCVEADRRGYSKAKVKLFVADGAVHIREMKNLHFPDAVFILDWAHAAQHLSDCAKALFSVALDFSVKCRTDKNKTTNFVSPLTHLAKKNRDRGNAPSLEEEIARHKKYMICSPSKTNTPES